MQQLELKIEDLFEFLGLDNKNYNEMQKSNENIYVKSDKNELIPVLSYIKKENKPIYKCTINGEYIEVADTHIFRSNNKEVFAKDSKGLYLDTLKDNVLVEDVEFTGYSDVYDFEVPSPHWYTHNENFANGLISHNTTFLCNEAVSAILQGKNVAYFTHEEQELDIRERIDAALMNIKTSELKIRGASLNTSFQHLVKKGLGRLKIKAYPPRTAGALTQKAQLEDWKLKDGFNADMIVCDSITIMAPNSKSDNLYGNGKAVSEETKGIGVEYGVPVISAVQTGRGNGTYDNADVTMDSVSESLATIQVASVIVGIMGDEKRPDVRRLNIAKSRKVNKSKVKSCIVNIDTDKQKVWDLSEGERKNITGSMKTEEEEINKLVTTATNIEKETKKGNYSALDSLLGK